MLSARTSKTASEPVLGRVDLFRVLSEPERLQLLGLCAEDELSVGELASLLKDSQPQVSRKVAALRQAGLLSARRDGTRTWLSLVPGVEGDVVVAAAISEGRRLCTKNGSLARLPALIARREDASREVFEAEAPRTSTQAQPEHMGHLAALAPLLPSRELAVDVGTGDGLLLDVLSPLYQRVLAVDRSRAQLARVSQRIASRGFVNVSLLEGGFDDASLLERVERLGGADLVYAGRVLHHASRPAEAVKAFARLLKPGGHCVVLDYLPHDEDALREGEGDVWLGFKPDDVRRFFDEALLRFVAEVPISPVFHPAGPDAQVTWHAWVARRPLSTEVQPRSNP